MTNIKWIYRSIGKKIVDTKHQQKTLVQMPFMIPLEILKISTSKEILGVEGG